ncbi:MAG: hypothetical protein JWP35_3540 [Caulobacter sp.]|nr:hypothetical protein [Caulobacter sp.]
MSGVELRFTVTGDDQVERQLAIYAARATKLRPLMLIFGAYLESSTKERFETNISPAGRAWKPSIRAQLRGGPTLVEHGHLRDSITHAANDTEVAVGTNLIYGGVHQEGATIVPKTAGALRFRIPGLGFRMAQKVTIPARVYLGMSDENRAEVPALAADYFDRRAA